MEKKVRVTIPKKIIDILERDIEEFKINKNTFLNYLYQELKNSYDKEKKICNFKDEETNVIQFNLNKKNREEYYDFLEENGIFNEAEFFREIIVRYAKMGRNSRELFLYKKNVEKIQMAIKTKKILKVTFEDKRVVEVEPYFLGSSKQELSNYLFCYNLEENEWKNYKLKYIEKVLMKNDTFKIRDKKYIDEIKKEFDPFLSKGKEVVVKLSKNGERFFESLEVNRPKILEKKDGIYRLECSTEKAKRYFSFFLDEAEILEPKELRKWFKEKYEKALKKYREE